jgi:20S proteasome subunit beta 6
LRSVFPSFRNNSDFIINTIQVGDGLEMYVVLAKGRTLQGLEGIKGMQELTTTDDGERVFVVRRELKKD